MNLIFSTALLCTALAGFGCATDPNRQVRDADAKHTADLKETEEERVDLEASQEQDHVALDAAHAKQDTRLDKASADDANVDDKRQADAQINVNAERDTFQTGATARLLQVEARVTALEEKKAKKKMLEPGLESLRGSFNSAKAAVNELNTVSDSKWFAAKQAVDTDLSALERDVGTIEARL